MIRIISLKKLVIALLITGASLYALFRIFNYFYPHNYCDYFSASAEHQSYSEIEAYQNCSKTLICSPREISIVNDNARMLCERKYKYNEWK